MKTMAELGFDNTAKIKQWAAQNEIPEIPKGRESLEYEIGYTVEASGFGSLKAGTLIKIVDRYMQHGYAYYVGENGMVHRRRDVRRI